MNTLPKHDFVPLFNLYVPITTQKSHVESLLIIRNSQREGVKNSIPFLSTLPLLIILKTAVFEPH